MVCRTTGIVAWFLGIITKADSKNTVPDYSEMLDDWQRRLEAAPAFGPTFEGFDYKTPEYNRLAETQAAVDDLSARENVSSSDVQKTANQFKDAFIANRQNLQKQLGPSVQPVNELLDKFYAESPGASDIFRNQGSADQYRHEIYSHLYPWEANLSPDYRGFQGNVISYPKSPITPLNEGVAVWTDMGMANPNPFKNGPADDGANIGGYFKDFVSRVAENDDAYAVPGGQEIWTQQYGKGKDLSQKLSDIGSLYTQKYIEPATKRYQNLAQAQAPGYSDIPKQYGGASRRLDELLRSADLANDELKNLNLPETFTKPFIERNLLYGTDPVTAGLQGAKEMLRTAPAGLAGGAALSALSPDVAQSLAQGKYGQAATQTAKDLAAGTAVDLGIRSAGQGLQRVVPHVAARFSPLVAAAADVAIPAAVGAGLFMQGQKGSPLNTLVNAASNTPFGLKTNPKTDVGRMAGNELQYALGRLLSGKIPYMGR